MKRIGSILVGAALLSASSLSGQTPDGPGCPPARYDLDGLKEALIMHAERGNTNTVAGMVTGALVPGRSPPACPLLVKEEDLDDALDDLIRWVAEQEEEDGALVRGVFGGALLAMRTREHPARPVALSALAFAVEHGRTDFHRGQALWTLEGLADRPQVRAWLLTEARAERGPPTWPDLPQAIVDRVYFNAQERNAALRAALESDPSLIRDPTARCWVERGGRPREFTPEAGPPCP